MVVDYEPTEEVLAFNTANGALLAFPRSAGASVRRLLHGDSAVEDPQVTETLARHGFLIDADDDEVGDVLRRLQLGIDDPNRLDVFVLPNMKCNFACPYCFEDHRASQMSDDVVRRLLAWFEQTVPRFKVVLVSWFGGEPLLSFDRMLEVQLAVREICREADVAFKSHVTTNGYLLTSGRAKALVDAGIRSYQITMDGPPDIHNASRVVKGGRRTSFDQIFDNLCALAREQPTAHVKLRVNYDAETLPRVPELLDLFPPDVRGRLNLVLERIFGQGTLYKTMSVRELAQATEATYSLARSMGFEVTTTGLGPNKLTYCYADRASEFVFNHEGDAFKCTVGNFAAKERMGTLGEDGRLAWDGDSYDDWMAIPAVDDKCRGCTYLPMCMGGCRKTRKFTGRASDDCTLPFAALDERIRRRYASEMSRREPVFVPSSHQGAQ